MLPLSYKVNIIVVVKRTPTDKELQKLTHVTCLLAHEWDPQNFSVPKSLCTVQEKTSSNIGAVMTEGGSPYLTNTHSDSYSVYQIYDIDTITSLIIGSFKVALIPSRNVSETKATVQDVPQDKKFQLKGSH